MTEELVEWFVISRLLIKPFATSSGTFLIKAPSSFAFVIVMASSLSSLSVSINDNTADRDASPIFAPALLMTS
jgi:hypothetical protein